jgi:hypothetical protein
VSAKFFITPLAGLQRWIKFRLGLWSTIENGFVCAVYPTIETLTLGRRNENHSSN